MDSPRETRQAHSLLIEARKPSASSSLKWLSAAWRSDAEELVEVGRVDAGPPARDR